MSKDPILEQIQRLADMDSDSRGKYLIHATLIENIIDETLGYHFCPDNKIKREMLVATIVNDLSFSTKINNLLKILKTDYPKLYKNYPKLKKQLENVRELRNKLAHSRPDFSFSFLEQKTDYVRLVFYNNGKKVTQDMPFKFIHKKLVESSNILVQLAKILEEVSNKKVKMNLRT